MSVTRIATRYAKSLIELAIDRGQIESCGPDGLLLVAGQPGEAVGEGVGDAELHRVLGSKPLYQVS